MTIHINCAEFDPDGLPPASKQAFFVEMSPTAGGAMMGFPVLVVNGTGPGKTLVVFAGVHGDEFEGVQAIHEVSDQLDPDMLRGRLIAVPVANLPAHRNCSRHSPVDNLNLARIFPGRGGGTLSERLAHHLSELLIARADFFIDLHSAGINYLIPPMVGYGISDTEQGRMAAEAAEAFGTPVVWGHPGPVPPGRTISEADRRGIPWLYVEATGGARIRSEELRYYTSGLFNLLRYLGMLPGKVGQSHVEYRLVGDGNIDQAITCTSAGFFVSSVRALERVADGQVIGVVRDMFGATLEEVRSKQEGFVILLRALPIVNPGDTVCVVTGDRAVPD
jgi:predicted deacylase